MIIPFPETRVQSANQRHLDLQTQRAKDQWDFSLWFWKRWWLHLGGWIYMGEEAITPNYSEPVYLFLCECGEPDMDHPDDEGRLECSSCGIFHRGLFRRSEPAPRTPIPITRAPELPPAA